MAAKADSGIILASARTPSAEEPAPIRCDIVAPVRAALVDLGYDAQFVEVGRARHDPFASGSTANAMLADAADKLEDRSVELTVARQIPLGALGLVDYALATSATLRDGLRRAERAWRETSESVELVFLEQSPHAALLLASRANEPTSRRWTELSFALLAQRIRHTVGHVAAFDIELAHEPPVDIAPYEVFFGGAVRFSQGRDRMTFPSILLEMPLRTEAESLAAFIDAKLRALPPRGGEADPFLAHARRAARATLARNDTGLVELSLEMNMSCRSLQRELQRRGMSYRRLIDEVRRDEALRLLENRALTVAEVAERLAFSEASAFFRAFRRWTGTTPKGSHRPAVGWDLPMTTARRSGGV